METWKLRYTLLVNGETRGMEEEIQWEEGYYQRLQEFWDKHQFRPKLRDPIYKVRSKNYVEFLSMKGFGGGIFLPVSKSKDLESAVLITDPWHPLIVTAPDGKIFVSDNYWQHLSEVKTRSGASCE